MKNVPMVVMQNNEENRNKIYKLLSDLKDENYITIGFKKNLNNLNSLFYIEFRQENQEQFMKISRELQEEAQEVSLNEVSDILIKIEELINANAQEYKLEYSNLGEYKMMTLEGLKLNNPDIDIYDFLYNKAYFEKDEGYENKYFDDAISSQEELEDLGQKLEDIEKGFKSYLKSETFLESLQVKKEDLNLEKQEQKNEQLNIQKNKEHNEK